MYAIESIGLLGGIVLIIAEPLCKPWLLLGVYTSIDYRQHHML